MKTIAFKNFNLPFNTLDLKVTNYTIADGLPSNQFSNNATNLHPCNQMIFGSISGITMFDPSRIITNTYKPPVVITDFLIRNKPVLVTKFGKIELMNRNVFYISILY